MKVNSLRRVLAAKATAFVGLAMLVAVVVLGITSVASVDTNSVAAQAASKFGAKEVIDANGPLPAQGTYTSKGGTLIISIAGSGYSGTAGQLIGMKARIDGSIENPTAEVYANNANEHLAFVPATIVVRGLPAGPVPIVLEKGPGATTTNADDSFKVTVIELRPGS